LVGWNQVEIIMVAKLIWNESRRRRSVTTIDIVNIHSSPRTIMEGKSQVKSGQSKWGQMKSYLLGQMNQQSSKFQCMAWATEEILVRTRKQREVTRVRVFMSESSEPTAKCKWINCCCFEKNPNGGSGQWNQKVYEPRPRTSSNVITIGGLHKSSQVHTDKIIYLEKASEISLVWVSEYRGRVNWSRLC